jgi:predicted CopG family antitoxin
MGTKTIGVKEEVYDRLQARKRDDESFSDLMNRLLDDSTPGWREGFGTLDAGEADELERAAQESRQRLIDGLASRQQDALEDLADPEESDETA